jgi:hypothetical protein
MFVSKMSLVNNKIERTEAGPSEHHRIVHLDLSDNHLTRVYKTALPLINSTNTASTVTIRRNKLTEIEPGIWITTALKL